MFGRVHRVEIPVDLGQYFREKNNFRIAQPVQHPHVMFYEQFLAFLEHLFTFACESEGGDLGR